MKLKLSRPDVWVTTIEDRAGGAERKLAPLAAAGANFEYVFCRRTPENPGKGFLLVTPVKGKKVTQAAQSAGFAKPANIHAVRIEGDDKPGHGVKVTRAIADAGVSFRGLAGTVVGKKFVGYLALDTADDAARVVAALKRLS